MYFILLATLNLVTECISTSPWWLRVIARSVDNFTMLQKSNNVRAFELWAVVENFLGKCLRVLDLLNSGNFSNSSLDVRLLLVIFLLYCSLEYFYPTPHIPHPFIQGLTLGFPNAPESTAQLGPEVRACLCTAGLMGEVNNNQGHNQTSKF